MGTSTTNQGKGTGLNSSTGAPAWANVGSSAYNEMNKTLGTAPMAAANQTLAQGGQGATTQNVIKQLMNGSAGDIGTPAQIGTQNHQSVFNAAGQPGAAQQYLTDYASGKNLSGNPYLNDIISKGAEDMSTQTNQMFAGGGRYGSGVHQGTLADSIGDMSTQARYNDYNQQVQNQLNAASAISGEQQGRLGLQQGAASGVAGVQGQNVSNLMQHKANRLSELGAAAGLENQGFQNMLGMISQIPGIQQNKVFDANQQMGVGGKMDQASQAQLNDLINQWSQNDMQDWARLGGLLTTGTGAAGNWGTQTGTSKTTQPFNPLGIIGGLLSFM